MQSIEDVDGRIPTGEIAQDHVADHFALGGGPEGRGLTGAPAQSGDGRHRGLIHDSEIRRTLATGEELTGYIRAVKDDYKIDLALEPVGFGRVTDLSGRILEALQAGGGRLEVGDASPPEKIHELFGASKKAFKQAVGTLYRKKQIVPGPHAIELVKPARR